MVPFLKSVARGYVSHYSELQSRDVPDLSRFCFVFPNKRAGTFFLKYLSEEFPTYVLGPKVTNISDFVASLSGRDIDSRLDLLFTLYKAYCEVVAPGVSLDDMPASMSFDSFRIWGETVLKDFSDVDLHNVPAEEIFKNLKDFRNISTDFLNDEQKEVIEEYFGKTLYSSTDTFWRVFDDVPGQQDDEAGVNEPSAAKEPTEGAKAKFIHLWQVLAPLYSKFNAMLDAENLATTGGAYLRAMRRLEEEGLDIIPYDKIVMVGFNALSHTERGIFAALRDGDNEYSRSSGDTPADFIWDSTGPVLRDFDNAAGRFVAVNRKRYPEPEWLSDYLAQSDTDALPGHLEVIKSPSNVLQAKIGGEELSRMIKEYGTDLFKEARVAMVLPDESLLLPLLYSLPPELGSPNLTMGYPLKMTAVSTFMTLIRNLQLSQRNSSGGRGFAVSELNRLLAHPITHAILGTSVINDFKGRMAEEHRIVATKKDIATISATAERLLAPVSAEASADEVISYLSQVLSMIEEAMTPGSSELIRRRLEHTHACTWNDALRRLADTIRRHGIKMSAPTLFYEADRLLSAEIVPFEGEPLEGLQIMGLLETRSLDFDHVVILSMNDRIMPRRSRQRTFIPDTLRRGFGMPPANYQEDIFAYYFYRLISRARSARLVYDARVGLSGGGPSRYVQQLEYLYAGDVMKRSERKLKITQTDSRRESTDKNADAVSILQRYRTDADPRTAKRFSASSLKKYCVCPLKFYIESLCGIRTDTKPTATLSAIAYGDIFHHIMERIYMPADMPPVKGLLDPPVRVVPDRIREILNDKEGLDSMVRREINRQYNHLGDDELDTPLQPAISIIARAMRKELEDTLRHDLDLAPFDMLGCEIGEDVEYEVSDDLKVRMTFKIDRLDRVRTAVEADGTEVWRVRIVDYKTGAVAEQVESLEDVFVNMRSANPDFQMMLYAELLLRWPEWQKRETGDDIAMIVYGLKGMYRKGEVQVPVIGEEPVESYSEIRGEFVDRLAAMLHDIYDKDHPFAPASDKDQCRYCDFKNICNFKAAPEVI